MPWVSYFLEVEGRMVAPFISAQVTANACATQAILNALMNMDGVELGQTLQDLKEFTASFDPQMKGPPIKIH